MEIEMKVLKNSFAIVCLVLLLIPGLSAKLCQAQSTDSADSMSARVSWHRLFFKADSFFGKVKTEVRLAVLPAKEAADHLIDVPQAAALQPSGATIISITVDSNIDPLFGSDEIIGTQSWFDPNGAAALQRIRLRQGKEKWQKRYRFTPKGVFRLRLKPKDLKEESLPLDQWTKIRNHFYSYGDSGLKCDQILEPASLLYIASANDVTTAQYPFSLCVFNKKQLHEVRLRVHGFRRQMMDYKEVSPDNNIVKKKGEIKTVKISMTSGPLVGSTEEAEKFSFLGLQGEIELLLHPASRIPLQISGRIAPMGRLDFKLQKVWLRSNFN